MIALPGTPRPVIVAYALPAFVVALPTIPVYIHLPTFYGVELGLGLAATGIALLVARLFDAVTDPLIGAVSDRFGFRGAHRKPWIAIGGVIAGFGLIKVLSPPADVDPSYLLLWSLVLYGGWTMVAVPYLAWGAELATDYDERTRITACREAMTLAGILGAGVLGAVAVEMGWTQRQSTGAIAWSAVGLGAILLAVAIWFVPDRASRRSQPISAAGLFSVLSNRPFLRLIGAWFLNGLANGVPAALFFLYLEFTLGAGEDTRAVFILIYFAAGIASIPLWTRLSRKFDKSTTWCCAMFAAVVAFIFVPLLPDGAYLAFGVICIVTGMSLGADLALPPAIQADVVDYDEWRFRRRRAGLQFALWGMSTKMALAAGVGLSLPALDALGFDPEAPDAAGKFTLAVIYAWVPAVIKVAAIALVWAYPLTRRRHSAIRFRLARRAQSGERTAAHGS
jgi:GPH family glycoside/pentoside/hexuronide:cation symporter